MGQPLRWSGATVNYYLDPGSLSSVLNHDAAAAMVDAAAAVWNNVPTAAVQLVDAGTLAEDVTGSNLVMDAVGRILSPTDVASTATDFPVGVIFDADGKVVEAIKGVGYARSGFCRTNGVLALPDGFSSSGYYTHALIVVNGNCTRDSDLLKMVRFQLERAFGRILGLDNSQVTPDAVTNSITDGTAGWPIMQPNTGLCGNRGGNCLPDLTTLRYDDIAALSRLYPVTATNIDQLSGKVLTAANTVTLSGTVSFANGLPMQGVNVVARPLDSSGNPLYQYTVTAVTGVRFRANWGNAITGTVDGSGVAVDKWGSTNTNLRGAFDLSGILLPPGVSAADYQISFESIDGSYSADSSVGPFKLGTPTISGSIASVTLTGLAAGSSQTLTIKATGSAQSGGSDTISTASSPAALPVSGFWSGRLSQIGQSDWFLLSVRGNRSFTMVTIALDESGSPSKYKAMPVLGLWDASQPVTDNAVAAGTVLNGGTVGESWVGATTQSDGIVRLGVLEQRGDGRPDYVYRGWVLYADTVTPQTLPASGGAIVIKGMGFRSSCTVLVGGKAATITSLSPTEITAIAPASSTSGSMDVEVDDLPELGATAIMGSAISYNAGDSDALTLVTAPSGTVSLNVPYEFTVRAQDVNLKAVGGLTVTWSVVNGTATLGCGSSTCSVTTSGDGLATLSVTPTSTDWAGVAATLTNGSMIRSDFQGASSSALTALTPLQSVAAGATATWTAKALALSGGSPASGQTVTWTPASGIATPSSSSATTNTSGVATLNLNVGPLTEGQYSTSQACLNGSSSKCASFSVIGARAEYASMTPISGDIQTISSTGTPNQIALRVYDMNGNPMAGAAVTIYQAVYSWTAPCSRHRNCASGTLLATSSTTAVSGLDGSVVFAPASIPGVATKTIGLASTGATATVSTSLERLPE